MSKGYKHTTTIHRRRKRIVRNISMIYFIQAADNGLIKIGHTVDIETRIRALISASPVITYI